MTKLDLINFIKEIELFRDLNNEELGFINDNLEPKYFKPQQILFDEDTPRQYIFLIYEGEVELFKTSPFGEEKRLSFFRKFDFIGEGSIMDDAPHSTSARAIEDVTAYVLDVKKLKEFFQIHSSITIKILSRVAKVISRRITHANARLVNVGAQYVSGRTRLEHDLLGERQIPDEYYFGIQTMRALENFNISGLTLTFFPLLIEGLAVVKKAAALANMDLNLLDKKIGESIVKACDLIINGNFHKQFVVDMIQGGAGTSTNMNANEVIANVALDIMGKKKGEYEFCHPNNHVNLSQSTNDAYPTAVKIALINSNKKLIIVLNKLIASFRAKAEEFSGIIKMGRTQLQDAVPMTLGQEFEAYAVTLEDEIQRLNQNAKLFYEVNMGATAIGTGINAHPDYAQKCIVRLQEASGMELTLAKNLVEATQDTGAFVMYSSAIKRLSIKLSKICNDLRLLSSGPRAGLNEINLPPMQPGSSIMPGKVNPVIPEVVNQIAFKVIGNDLTVSLAAEAGQLELNVMEPVIVQSLIESTEMLKNGMEVLKFRCIDGITANEQRCRELVHNSIGLVTALNPYIGYEASSKVAKKALETGRSVYELVLEMNLLSQEHLDEILKPENMIKPGKIVLK